MFASVTVVAPGALHVPSTIATECDELASNPIKLADRVEFDPEMSVTVTVPEGPKDPVAVTCTVRGTGVGAVASEQAAIAQTAIVLMIAYERLIVSAPMGLCARRAFTRGVT
jgi:hypothetical protein